MNWPGRFEAIAKLYSIRPQAVFELGQNAYGGSVASAAMPLNARFYKGIA